MSKEIKHKIIEFFDKKKQIKTLLDGCETLLKFNCEIDEENFIIEINISNKYINKDNFIVVSDFNNLIFDNNLKHVFKIDFYEKNFYEILEFDKYKYLIRNKDIKKEFMPYDINYVNVNKISIDNFLNNYLDKIVNKINNYYIELNKKIEKLKKNRLDELLKIKNFKLIKFNSFIHNENFGVSIYENKVIYFKFNKSIYYFVFFNNCLDIDNNRIYNCSKYLIDKINSYLKDKG